MAFSKKTWVDRLVEFAGRRKITNVSTMQAQIVDVERAEGTVSQEGSAFSAQTMNDLEQRIADGFSSVEQSVSQVSSELLKVSSIGMIFTDYNGYALEKSIAYVIDRMRNSGTQFATATFNSNDVWYLLMAHIEGSGRASGIVKDAYGAPMYNMWRWEGADAVLKKLGSNPVPINFSFNSSEYAGNTGESYPRITLTYSLSEFSSLDLSISRAISGSSTPWSGSVAIDGITIWSKEMNNDNTPFSVSNYDVSGKNTLTISIENRASQSNSSTISVTGTIK